MIRINRYIRNSGFCSRRKADMLIVEKRVTINEKIALIGDQVSKNDKVKIDGILLKLIDDHVYILLNKPKGIICTNDLKVKNNIRKYINHEKLIFPVGRLDADSTGLIMLTNNGDIVNKLLRPNFYHEKEYLVTVDKKIDENFIYQMKNGIEIYNQVAKKMQVTRKCEVVKKDDYSFKIILTQGLNRQIRRMCETLGYQVLRLSRIRFLDFKIDGIIEGTWRNLSKKEINDMLKKINMNE